MTQRPLLRSRLRLMVATGAVLLAAAGCSTPPDVPDSAMDTSVYDDTLTSETFDPSWREKYEQTLTLPGARKVSLRFNEDGDRLLEQHYSPKEDAWTAPQVIYTSEEPDPCQGVEMAEEDGVVAAFVDFGMYCYDGEAPMESVAVVAAGDLTEWQTHVTYDFDGWTAVDITDGEVTWTGRGEQVHWADGDGFSD